MISRRRFIISSIQWGSLAGIPCSLSEATTNISAGNEHPPSPQARYWTSTGISGTHCMTCHNPAEKLAQNIHLNSPAVIKCLLCAHNCILRPGERGRCRARINDKGILRSLVYGHPVAIHVDPIEKKPFYHFLPGTDALSLATSGCPLQCRFCQNWEISQSKPEDFNSGFTSASDIVQNAKIRKAPVIAFTYNEPTVFLEYMADITAQARKQKIRCVMVSCGFMNPDPLKEMCQILDAIKIDLKGFSEDFYRNVCKAELHPVLNNIRRIAKSGVHLELVNLVVPTLNDSEKMMRGLIEWILAEIGPDIPIHFTRFHPDYQLLNLPPTPVGTLEKFRDFAMNRGIRYAYIGNVPDHPGNHTYCPGCGKVVIRRKSIFLEQLNLDHGKCKYCGRIIAGIWS
jgi:pyruvate formate lyase activating enzyme